MPDSEDPQGKSSPGSGASDSKGPQPFLPGWLSLVAFVQIWGGWICLGALGFQTVLIGMSPTGTNNVLRRFAFFTGLIILLVSLIAAVAAGSDPEKEHRSIVQRWGALITVLALMLGFGVSGTILWFATNVDNLVSGIGKYEKIVIGLILLAMFMSGWWFVKVFTNPLPTDRPAQEKDLIPMVRFCYVFTLLVLTISVVGPVIVTFFSSKDYDQLSRGPISLVKGCVHSSNTSWELACSDSDPFKLEWFINIGGSARLAHFPSANASQLPNAVNLGPIDQLIDVAKFRPVIVHGGLVIPWYFIALALMGAAVSLARRIPEYQRRALDLRDPEFTPARARELMEFQILQLLSAPLIAFAAYNLVTPSTLQASTALGFAAGFSSETILLAIRGLSDRLLGETKQTPQTSSMNPPDSSTR
jgi:hypothetical protein